MGRRGSGIMSTRRFQIAVKALIVRGGKILVLRRSAGDEIDPGSWEIPGGRLEWGEDAEQALAREVLEETGLAIEVVRPVSVWCIRPDEAVQVIGITFLARHLRGEIRLGAEHDLARWILPFEAEGLDMHSDLRGDINKHCESGFFA